MATYYTNLVKIELQKDIPKCKWREIFSKCGRSMNMCMESFDEFGDDYTLTDNLFTIMFITNQEGPFLSYAQNLYHHFVKLCPDVDLEYAYDSYNDKIHGFWKNGTHQQEEFYELFEVINGTYTPLSIQKENDNHFTITGTKKIRLNILSKKPVFSFNMLFSKRYSGMEYFCMYEDTGPVQITEYNGKFYSDDLEFVYEIGIPKEETL